MDTKQDTPKFAQIRCSQCGCAFGPGNAGFSHCSEHPVKPDEVFFTSKFLTEPIDGNVQVKALFVDDEEGLAECAGLYVGNMDLFCWLMKEHSAKVEMEARDALLAKRLDERQAAAETRAECRRDDARADAFIPLRGLSLHYQSTPTAEQMAAVDETMGASV
jgi:hypothetical protein